ncbi:S-layer homology domain-containing protein [Thermophilibacter mediterraneus]|uniref:S-layer homology domain-containing protein n=1 Tax=Thermophilibacter mediterraneus TaxID=1871031 RepID=UPI000931E08A|nr:S-layer homology domain-containing protein [Thermophilibacter mediterraneus]
MRLLLLAALVALPATLYPVTALAAPAAADPSIVNDVEGLEIEGTVVTKYTGTAAEVVIPAGVTEIDDFAFQNNKELTSVVLPESVKVIGEDAFRNCTSLAKVTMPGVESTGRQAFEYTALVSVDAPELITLGERTFRCCSSLTSVSLPRVQDIGSMALSESALTEFTFPSSVKKVAESFLYASNVKTITVSLDVLLTAEFDNAAFRGAFRKEPYEKTQVILTDVGEAVTLTECGVKAGERTVEFEISGGVYDAPFCVTQVKAEQGASGFDVVNMTGDEVMVNDEPVLTGSVKPVDATNDAYLYSLGIDEGYALEPDFSNQLLSFSTAVEYTAGSVTVCAVPSDDGATVRINDTPAGAQNDWSVVVPLKSGENEFSVVVTAADGQATRTYTLTVTQKPRPVSISIGTADELLAFAEEVNKGSYTGVSDVSVVLTADIDLTDIDWVPMGWDGERYFSGTFDGAGHSITGLSIERDAQWTNVGLFGFSDGDICNLTVSGSIVNDITDQTVNIGMIVGLSSGSEVTNCSAEGKMTGAATKAQCVGGVVGYADSSTLVDCASSVEISIPNAFYVGGVAGALVDSRVAGCANDGPITITNGNACSIGGVIGNVQTSQGSCSVERSTNRGAVQVNGAMGWYAGGVIGDASDGVVIEHCANASNVSGNASCMGGVIGYSYDYGNDGSSPSVSFCLNSGTVANGSESGKAGGIAGSITCPSTGSALRGCVSTGQVSGGACGPIAGQASGGTDGSFSENYHVSSIGSSEGAPACGSTGVAQVTQEIVDTLNEAGGSYRLADDGTVEISPLTYTLTIDYGYEGRVEVSEQPKGAEVALDAGTRPGYSFSGWALSGGGALADASSAQTTLVMPASDVTVTASWKANPYVPPADPTYPPNVSESEGGTVVVTPDRPGEGDEVTVEPVPDDGQEVREVTVTDEGGEAVPVADNGDGTWTFVQPDGAVTVTVIFGCDGGGLCPTHGFNDVDQSAWYHDAVDWAVAEGVLNGYGEGGESLGPVADVTRAEMAQMLWNRAGRPEAEADLSAFTDVDAGGWYAPALEWCVSEGIFSGYGDTFGTERTISREEAATVLWRVAGSPEADADLSGYGDASRVSDYATGAIEWAVSTGVLTGKGDVALDPQAGCTRGEVAAMMMRMAQ